MNILVVAAHPDDEVLGCGGTIARLVNDGHNVKIYFLCIRHLDEVAHDANTILGATTLYPSTPICRDQRFDAIDLLDLTQAIEESISFCKPVAIYTHHTGDLNLDHALTARAVLTATRPKPGCAVKDVYMFEVPSSTEWGFNYQFKPNVFVDVTQTRGKKVQAMQLYQSEMRQFPHPRSIEMLTAMMAQRGSMVGVEAAEAFELVRSLR